MIQVPIDRIMPIDDALPDIKALIEKAGKEKSLYVLTKAGKPYAAIIDIDYLEHLPEMEDAGETKAIHEIGKEESEKKESESKIVQEAPEVPEEPAQKSEGPVSRPEEPVSSEEPNISEKPTIKTESEAFDETVGPWKTQGEEAPKPKENPEGIKEPPDLEIG